MASLFRPATQPKTATTPRQVLADSGPLIALFNRGDAWHGPVVHWLEHNPQAALLTTWPVLTEVCALLAKRMHNEVALDFLRWGQSGGFTLNAPHASEQTTSVSQVIAISERFKDLPFDLADASIAESAARLNIRHVLTIDADFDVYRNPSGQRLRHVLRDGWET